MLRSFDDLEAHPLTIASVVRSRANGSIVLVDNEVWSKAQNSTAVASDQEHELNELFSVFTHAGMFCNPKQSPFLPPQDQRSRSWTQHLFGLGDRRVLIRCAWQPMAKDLVSTARSLLIESDCTTAHATIEIFAFEEDFTVVVDSQVVSEHNDMAVTRHCALSELLTHLHGPENVSAILHAAAVELGDKAVILAGDSGAGKSTLAYNLIKAGGRLIADDLTAVSTSSCILPFPTRLSLKPGTWHTLPRDQLDGALTGSLGSLDVRYIDPPRQMSGDSSVSASAILFPKWSAMAAHNCTPIVPEEAFTRLVRCGARITGHVNSVEAMARLVRKTPAFELVYSDSESALDACAQLAPW